MLLPCALLVAFGYVMIQQDRELAARHADDEKRARALQQHQEQLAQLEQMKRTAEQEFFAGRKPPVDFAALIVDGNVRAPWENAGAVRSPEVDSCERQEFTAGRLSDAIACYDGAVRRTSDPGTKAYARLLLGRALARAGYRARAMQADLELLATPTDITDDQGVPFAYYAADRLLRNGADSAVKGRFGEMQLVRSPTAAYLLKSIADRIGDAHIERQAAAAVEFAKQIESLRADLPGLLPILRRDAPEPVWIEHGTWQIGLGKAPESGKELLVGIASSRLRTGAPPANAIAAAPARTGIYVASLGLVFLIAASGAYLLWRDVRRDVQLAEMRSQFVSSVSHELKTPLTAIRMFAETLSMRSQQDVETTGGVARSEYLETIVNESERLSRLVDNVLDFSKIEQGRKLYRLQPTSLAAVIDAVLRAVRYPLQQAGFVLNVSGAQPLPEVNADADALQQAVLNLVMNAVKYSRDRKEIELDVRNERGAVVIAVRDYGIGIAAEHRQRIFERFYRVPSAQNQLVPGAGLGLTLVAHIAKAHGGDVTVESTPDAGSLFALRLPALAGNSMEQHA